MNLTGLGFVEKYNYLLLTTDKVYMCCAFFRIETELYLCIVGNMRKTLFTLILIILLSNCSDKNQSGRTQISIDNKTKAEFLNEILSDTTNFKLLPDQNIMISDFNLIQHLPRSVSKNGEFIKVSEIEFLSHHLKENDTVFIKQQIKDNNHFNLKDLSNFGYRILNTTELLKDGTSVYDLSSIVLNNQTKTDKLYNGYFVLLDKPIFNKELNRAYLSVNGLNSGTEYLFVKKNETWIKENIGSWVE